MDSKIVLVGIGHVFNLDKQIKDIVRKEMPDAIALELDVERANALIHRKKGRAPFFYSLLAKVQNLIARKFGVETGKEMLSSIEIAKELDIPIIYIDMNSRRVMDKLWRAISLKKKIMIILSSFLSIFYRKGEIEKKIKEFKSDEFTEELEKHFPEIKKILIDERNEYMAENLKNYAKKYDKIVAIVGEGHIKGLKDLLENFVELEIIHLSQLIS